MSAPKILVVEDETSISNLVVSYLRKEGYEVFAAADGPSGLKAARAVKPDLIVLDIMLPGSGGRALLGGSGFTLQRRRRTRRPSFVGKNTPVGKI